MMFLPEILDNDTLTSATCNSQLGVGALPCDAWHHYYHYQASAQYLWLAETLREQGRAEEALAAYDRAIFQDHFNEEALAGKKDGARKIVPSYDKHPAYDLEFRSLIGQLPDDATKPHDEGATAFFAGDYAAAIAHLDKAIDAVPHHSNSYFMSGKCFFFLHRQSRDAESLEKARADFAEAIRLSHLHHDAYHRAASAEHLARGYEFLKQNQLDLAVNDFTKALDLHRGNKEALKARAQAYRAKGSISLAEEDERKLGI